MEHFKHSLLTLSVIMAFSCSKAKTWSCECENSQLDHGIYEGPKEEAETWCTAMSNTGSCALIGHK